MTPSWFGLEPGRKLLLRLGLLLKYNKNYGEINKGTTKTPWAPGDRQRPAFDRKGPAGGNRRRGCMGS
jgi:hypothetical protein